MVLKVKHSFLQIGMQTVAPHTLRGFIHALLLRFAGSFHSNAARRAGPTGSTTGSTRTSRA